MLRERPRAGRRPFVELEARRRRIAVRLVELLPVGRREAAAPAIPEVRLGRSERPPVGGDLEALRVHRDEFRIEALDARLEEQLLDDHLGHGVLALAEVVVADPSLGVGDVQGRPVVVGERLPDAVVAVDRDRVVDLELPRPRDDVVDVPLEPELGRVERRSASRPGRRTSRAMHAGRAGCAAS